MARPTGANSEKTKRQILEAAVRRFGQDGVKGTTLKAIAGDCGITFATIHHYFGGKAALYDAALDASYAELDGLQDSLSGVLAEEGSVHDRIARAARCVLAYAQQHRHASRFLLRATLYEEAARARTTESQTRYLEGVSQLLSPFLERPAHELRVPLQGFMFLLTRIAVMDDEDVVLVGGEQGEAATRSALEDYVVTVALHTLAPVGETARVRKK